jgi:hypothetical protein
MADVAENYGVSRKEIMRVEYATMVYRTYVTRPPALIILSIHALVYVFQK